MLREVLPHQNQKGYFLRTSLRGSGGGAEWSFAKARNAKKTANILIETETYPASHFTPVET